MHCMPGAGPLGTAASAVPEVGLRANEAISITFIDVAGSYRDNKYTMGERREVAEVLVDLKRRIQGEFFVIEENEEKIVLGNRVCPFADKVVGRPAMCRPSLSRSSVVAHSASERPAASVPHSSRIASNSGRLSEKMKVAVSSEENPASTR